MKICTTCGREWPDDTKFCPNDGSTLRAAGGQAQIVGSVIADRYHIVKKLGEGGMGAVYLGEHVKMGRKSAIKVMAQSMANDPDAIARFNREAANAARINHPNVCQIYDFGETPDGLIYLAMEFIEGEALTDLIEREGMLAAPRAAEIIRQAADALATAHDMGIVHRDLKPDNIMVSRGRADRDLVKVVDFGIAKAMGGEEGQKVTKTGLVVGTPEYMSPEQLSGDKLDGRSDIYSLALVLYRMLTGTLPFQADSAQEVMIKRLTDEPTPLNEACPGVGFPDRLQQVLSRALARMPSERYDSAAAFGRDVAAAVEGMPAPDRGAADPEGATVLMDTADVTAARQAAPTEQLASTRVSGEPPRVPSKTPTPDTAQPQPAVRPPEPTKKAPVGAIAAAVVGLAVVGGGAAWMLKGGGEPTTGGAGPGDTARVSVPVTDGTAPDTAAADTDRSPSRGNQPATGGRTEPAGGRQPPPVEGADTRPAGGETERVIDSAAVHREIDTLTDPLLEGQSLSARAVAQLESIYRDTDMPGTLRGLAARQIMQQYVTLDQRAEACLWGERALAFPMSDLQRNLLDGTRRTLGCPS